MVRREIKSFEIESSLGAVTLDVPFSIASAILSGKISESDVGGGVAFSASVFADSATLSVKNIYIRLGRFSAPCDVFINERKVGRADGEGENYLFDASGALTEGENKLTLRFDGVKDPELIGVFAPVEILRFNNAIIDKISVTQKHEDGAVTVGIRLGMIGNGENVRAVATLTSPVGQMYYVGFSKGFGSINVPDPLYWLPHGQGVQNLYKLTVNLYGETEIEDTAETRIGLRTVDLSGSPDGSFITVNGVTVLPMGAVYRAEKDLSSPALEKRINAFVTYAAMANYNTLVIPKDSPRPSDKLYDLCDVHGIMIFEETETISERYIDAVERRAHHPSLCLLDVAKSNSQESVESLKAAVPGLGMTFVEAFTNYPSHPSFPDEKTIASVLSENEKNPVSSEMERISDTETTGKIITGIIERFPYPSSLGALSYTSQVASANRLSEEMKKARLAEGGARRAVFDGLGDSAVIASSSAIDAAARRKALQFYSHKFFAPIALFAENNGGKVRFSASSQRKIDFVGTVEYRIVDSKNVTVYKNTEPIEFEGMSAKELFTKDLSEYVSGHEKEYFLEYSLREGTTLMSSGVLLFVPEKHFAFEDPRIYCEVSGSEKKFSLTVTAKNFAKDVEFSLNGIDAVFSDNYISLTSTSPVKITLNVTSGIETAIHLKDALRIRSVYDVKKFN